MLEAFFSCAEVCEQFRSGSGGRYLDDYAEYLARSSYRRGVGCNRLHTARHFASWAQSCDLAITALDERALERFCDHLSSCNCVAPNGGTGKLAKEGARLFLRFLDGCGVVSKPEDDAARPPAIVHSFRDWMAQHRGVTEATLRDYGVRIVPFLKVLGDDPSCYQAQNLRDFVQDYASKHKIKTTKYMITVIRMFLRFLAAEGKCAAGLEYAIPTLANWRLSTLPRSLPASEVEKVVDSCDVSTGVGARDRAILLLSWRLAFRSGDILGLGLSDINWAKGTVMVCGKGGRQTELPLPQEVGDALLTYLECRPAADTDKVFVRVLAPIRPLKGPGSVAVIVKRALERAGVEAPMQGTHLLRHSAATEMLRQGVSLQDIQAVLRHRSIETTTIYAKVDVRLLKQIAQPWPEVGSC